jgi:hypothetical protein
MATVPDLIATVQRFMTAEVTQQLATLVDERPAVIQKALRGIAPAMLGGVLNLGTQRGGISQLQRLLTPDDRLPEGFGSILGSNAVGLRQTGQDILGTLFGGKLDSVVESIASTAGAKATAVSSLFTLVAPLIMSVLDRQARVQGLTATGLLGFLAAHKEAIVHLIPPSLTSAIGLAGITIPDVPTTTTRFPHATLPVTPATARESGWPAWWLWALALGVLLLLGVWYVARATPNTPRERTSLGLFGGEALDVGEPSLSYALVRHLADPSDKELPRRFVLT